MTGPGVETLSLANGPEAVAGFLLVFFVPGYALTRALFPEWRLKRPGALRRLVETLTLSFVLSIVLTVLVGYLLLSLAPRGFQAYWSDPLLEAVLFVIAAAGLVTAALRGAFGRGASVPSTSPSGPGEEGAWELTLELDRLRREERRLVHALRRSPGTSGDNAALEARLQEVRERSADLARQRDAEYAG